MMYKNPLLGSKNIFITGAGGTGKTYAINDYIATHPGVLLCASTGTAAVNIGGTTAHKLFSIPVPAYGADPNKVTASQLKIFANIDTVIIDEISMMRNDAFSFAIRVLKRAEKLYGKKIRLIVSGDFSQLPPVIKKTEEKYFTKYGYDKSGFCFTTKEWADLKFKIVNLTEVKRQTDVEFVEKLSAARMGDDSITAYFNKFVSYDIPEDAVRLCGTNAEADQINKEYLDSIEAPMFAYQAEKTGITGKELPCDEIVLLKVGCRVMFTANDTFWTADGELNKNYGDKNGVGQYTNGLLATVTGLFKDKVAVHTEDGRDISVGVHKWTLYKYTVDRGNGLLKKDEIGSVNQMPLKVAKAITIHKSQGKTFSKMVLSPKIFAAGQLYVALSRVTGPDGLYLTEPIVEDSFRVDPTVKKFYENDFTWEVSEAQVKKQKDVAKKMAKKTTKKKAVAKKRTTAKNTTAKRVAKKPATKKTATKKTTAKKSAAKKTVKKTTPVKKTTARSTVKTTKKVVKTQAKRKPAARKTTRREK